MAHFDDQLCRARGTSILLHLYPPLKRWAILFRPAWRDCRECVRTVPSLEGTRQFFPSYPALRLRLRAGLDYFSPTALDFRQQIPLANTKFASRTHLPCLAGRPSSHKLWSPIFTEIWSAHVAKLSTTEDDGVSKPAVDCPEDHFGNRAFHCVNPAMAIDLQLNEHSFGEVAASLPADGFLDCECGRPGTPASVHGPPDEARLSSSFGCYRERRRRHKPQR